MSVSLSTARSLVTEILNESHPDSGYGVLVGRRYKAQEIIDAVIASDAMTAMLYIKSKDRQAAFTTSSTVASGGQIPSHIGDIIAFVATVSGGIWTGTQPLVMTDFEAVMNDNRNPQGLSHVGPKGALMGEILFHTGVGVVAGGASSMSVTVYYLTFTLNASVCQSPDEALWLVVAGALAILFLKDGNKTGASQQAYTLRLSEAKMLGLVGQGQMAEAA